MPPGRLKNVAKGVTAASRMARKGKEKKDKDKDKKKKKKKKKDDDDDNDDDEDEDEWVVDSTLDDVLASEAKNLEEELKEQGKGIAKEKRKTAVEKKREKDLLTKAEIKVRQAEQAQASNMFAVDGKVKDKRDMIGKGGGEDQLFDFEVGLVRSGLLWIQSLARLRGCVRGGCGFERERKRATFSASRTARAAAMWRSKRLAACATARPFPRDAMRALLLRFVVSLLQGEQFVVIRVQERGRRGVLHTVEPAQAQGHLLRQSRSEVDSGPS